MAKYKVTAKPKLAEIRSRKELTQKDMADFLQMKFKDFSYANYQKCEQGVRSVELEVAAEIAEILDTPIKDLFSRP